MSKITTLFVLFAICVAIVVGRGHKGKHGGGDGHHMREGHMMGPGGLGKEADAIMCKPENMVDDKFDQFRAEISNCEKDGCLAKATELASLTKPENKFIAKMHCSPNYKACMKEMFSKMHHGHGKGHHGDGDDQDDHEPSEDMKKQWKEKMQAKRVKCS